MPPKRKAGGAAKAGGKKAKTEEPAAGPSTLKDAIATLKSADKGKKKTFKPDASFPFASSAEVFVLPCF